MWTVADGVTRRHTVHVRIAFKEWAVVVDALAQGDQILILRRGGLSERPGGFQLEHDRFLLFPTLFHQQRDFVIPSAQSRYDVLAPGLSSEMIRIECFAEVIDWKRMESLDAVLGLRGQHIWREEVVRERFERGGKGSLYALALRVFRLPLPVEIKNRQEYGGCRSWIELEEQVAVDDAQPVLLDGEFAARLARFEQALSPAASRDHATVMRHE